MFRCINTWHYFCFYILLLELCLNATYLQVCYQQRQGTAMGSPVFVTIANLVMEDVEQRALSSFSEHQKAVATINTDTSALAEHVLSKDHRIDWENTSIIDQHPFTQTRCLVESWYINHTPNTLNRERGPLPEIYQSLKTTSTITSHTHHATVKLRQDQYLGTTTHDVIRSCAMSCTVVHDMMYAI